jgi:hypothetical protein
MVALGGFAQAKVGVIVWINERSCSTNLGWLMRLWSLYNLLFNEGMSSI